MKLTLHNFMKHEDYTVNFKPGIVTLITGESENGKSSLLYSIEWCLHGGVQKVYRENKDQRDKVVWVSLEFKNIRIRRQARPGQLTIKLDSKEYKGNAAQTQIDKIFGTKDIWLACSFVEQKCSSYLLESNAKARMEILRSLAFDDENPEIYIKKLITEKQTEKDEYEKILIEYNIKKKIHDDKFSDKLRQGLNWKTLIQQTEKKITTETEKLVIRKKNLIDLEQKNEVFQQDLIKKKVFIDELNKTTTQLESLGEIFTETDLNQLQTKIENLETQIRNRELNQKKLTIIEALNKKKTKYSKKIGSNNIEPSQKIYIKTLQNEKEYQTGFEKANKLNVEYNKQKINFVIQDLEKKIQEHQTKKESLAILKRLIDLENELSKLPDIQDDINSVLKRYENIKQELEDIKLGLDVLECPYCQNPVNYKRSEGLIKSEASKTSSLEYDNKKKILSSLERKIEHLKVKEGLVNKIKELNDSLSDRQSLKNYTYTEVDYRKWIDMVAELKHIVVVEPPKFKSKYVRYAIKIKDIDKKLQELGKIDYPIGEKKNLKGKLKMLKKQYDLEVRKKQNYWSLSDRCSVLKNKIKNIVLNDVRQEYEVEQQLVIELETNIKKLETELEQLKSEAEMDKIISKVEKTKNNLDVLEGLIKKANDLSCEMLENTVATINNTINPILSKIFDKSVRVKLDTHKKLKTGNKIKQSVNMKVYFDAEKYEKRFCGGERDRLSIGILLALNRLSKSPFIMMDELMGTVSDRIVEKCVKQIKKYVTSDKYVLCVEHRMITGIYDEVIQVSQ
jgi:DNA repair exonuclease SbcCD ATPase subunit